MSKSEVVLKELGKLTGDELQGKLLFLKKELFNLRFQKTLGEQKNTSRFSIVKKNIARIKTELARRLKTGE